MHQLSDNFHLYTLNQTSGLCMYGAQRKVTSMAHWTQLHGIQMHCTHNCECKSGGDHTQAHTRTRANIALSGIWLVGRLDTGMIAILWAWGWLLIDKQLLASLLLILLLLLPLLAVLAVSCSHRHRHESCKYMFLLYFKHMWWVWPVDPSTLHIRAYAQLTYNTIFINMHAFLFIWAKKRDRKKKYGETQKPTKRMERATEYGCEFCILEDRFSNFLFSTASQLSICMENIGD